MRFDQWAVDMASDGATVKPKDDGSFVLTGVSEGDHGLHLSQTGMQLLSRMLVLRAGR